MSDAARLWQEFRDRAASFATRTALIAPEGELSFGGLIAAAEGTASALAAAGVQEGSVVGLSLPNGRDFAPVYLALCKLSATVALVSPKYGANELSAIAEGVGLSCLVTADAPPLEGRREVAAVPELARPLLLTMLQEKRRRDIAGAAALLKFTSGSTGEPKGIALGADQLLAEAANVVAGLALTHRDRVLAPVPLCHSYGFDLGVLAMLYAGAELDVNDAFVPRPTLAALAQTPVSVFLGVPSMYRVLVRLPGEGFPDLGRVRYLLSCTAPLPPPVIGAFHARFRAPICQHYGSSETGAVTTHVAAHVLERLESVGQPMGDVGVRILDAAGREVPAGEEGEVVVTSRAVARAYVMGAPAERAPFRDGACWTGDLGRVEQGFLYVHGRVDGVINVGGLKVSPREVAQVLESHPAVSEAAVTGVPDAGGEEVVYAVVAVSGPATEQEILSFCRTRLAEYKVPRRVDIRTSLPHGAPGKVQLRREDLRL